MIKLPPLETLNVTSGAKKVLLLTLTLPFDQWCYTKCQAGSASALLLPLVWGKASIHPDKIHIYKYCFHLFPLSCIVPFICVSCFPHLQYLGKSSVFLRKNEWMGTNNKHSHDWATLKSEQLSESIKLWWLLGSGSVSERAIVVDKNLFFSLSGLFKMGHRINGLRWWIVCGGVRWASKNRKVTINALLINSSTL